MSNPTISNASVYLEEIIFIDIESKEEIKTYYTNTKFDGKTTILPRIGETLMFFDGTERQVKHLNSYIIHDIVHNYTIRSTNDSADKHSILVYCERQGGN